MPCLEPSNQEVSIVPQLCLPTLPHQCCLPCHSNNNSHNKAIAPA